MIWKRIERREIIKATNSGIYLKIKGLNAKLHIILKITPFNFNLKSKPKMMSISKDQYEWPESNRLEKLSFNKKGSKLQKLDKKVNYGERNYKPQLLDYLGKRQQEEDKFIFDSEKDNFYFNHTAKRMKTLHQKQSQRKYFDLRSYYQSGKGSVKVKNIFKDKTFQYKMTKSVQKIDYVKQKNENCSSFISPLKTLKMEKKNIESNIKTFNQKRIKNAHQIFEKTPSREGSHEIIFDRINSGDFICHLCNRKSKKQYLII